MSGVFDASSPVDQQRNKAAAATKQSQSLQQQQKQPNHQGDNNKQPVAALQHTPLEHFKRPGENSNSIVGEQEQDELQQQPNWKKNALFRKVFYI